MAGFIGEILKFTADNRDFLAVYHGGRGKNRDSRPKTVVNEPTIGIFYPFTAVDGKKIGIVARKPWWTAKKSGCSAHQPR